MKLAKILSVAVIAVAASITMVAVPASAQSASASASATTGISTWERVRSSKTLRLGAAVQDPFVYKDPASGEWRGISVDIAARIAKALDAKLEIVELSWAGGIAAIQNNQVDLFIGFDGTPERAAAIEFINVPIYRYGFAFYGNEKVNATSWSSLNSPSVAIGVVLGQNFDTVTTLRAPRAKIRRFPTQADMLSAFQANQIDGMIVTSGGALMAKTKIGKGKITIVKNPETWLPILASIPPQSDQRWRNFLTTTLSYLADSEFSLDTVGANYVARGADKEGVTTYFQK